MTNRPAEAIGGPQFSAGSGNSTAPRQALTRLRRLLRGGRRAGAEALHLGDPVEVIVRVSGDQLVMEVPVGEWHGSHTPILRGERPTWFALAALDEPAGRTAIKQGVADARDARLGRYRTCGDCGERNPPEWMLGDTLCQRRAVQNRGVVF